MGMSEHDNFTICIGGRPCILIALTPYYVGKKQYAFLYKNVCRNADFMLFFFLGQKADQISWGDSDKNF